MATPTTFVYSPLQDPIEEIRLVVLQPCCSHADYIQCQIIHTTVDRQLEYEALSYMWGYAKNPREVFLNGKSATIRDNLWWALYHLRRSDAPRVLWIDALCINQEDAAERNHQVRQMRRIYSNASTVIVWLGQEAQDSNAAMDWIARADTGSGSTNSPDLLAEVNWEVAGVPLSNLCQRKYWDRLWIVQELCLAQRLWIYCGSKVVEWSAFRRLLTQIMAARLRISKRYRIFQQNLKYYTAYKLGTIREIRANKGQSHTEESLRYLCLETKESICLDPRDKIYGLLGLAFNDVSSSDIDVDYSRTLFEAFEDAIWHEYRQKTSNDGLLLHYAFELQKSFARTVSSKSIAETEMTEKLFALPSSESRRLIPVQAWIVGRIDSLLPAHSNDPNKSKVIWPLDTTKAAKLEVQSDKKPGAIITSKFLLEESYKIFPIFSSLSYAVYGTERTLPLESPSGGEQPIPSNRKQLSMLPGRNHIDLSTFQIFKTQVSYTDGHHHWDDDPTIPAPTTRPLYGIVPEEVYVGDILCRLDYEKENTYFILRLEKDRYIFLARSFVPGTASYDTPKEIIAVYMTTSVLQLLTSSYIPGQLSQLQRPLREF